MKYNRLTVQQSYEDVQSKRWRTALTANLWAQLGTWRDHDNDHADALGGI